MAKRCFGMQAAAGKAAALAWHRFAQRQALAYRKYRKWRKQRQ